MTRSGGPGLVDGDLEVKEIRFMMIPCQGTVVRRHFSLAHSETESYLGKRVLLLVKRIKVE